MLWDLLKKSLCQHKDKSISDGHITITYGDLFRHANNFRKQLTEIKYGILCKSELNSAKALVACLAAGKTAVLLSSRYGEKHSQKIIESMHVSFVIKDEGIVQVGESVCETENLIGVPLIMCTSGTTGNPKGAMITDEGIITNLTDIKSYFKINDTDKILIARPLYHCAVLTGEFFISILNGLNIEFYNEEFNPTHILKIIRNENITVLCGTPTLFYHLCNVAKRQPARLPLKTIAISGECMTPVVAEMIRKALPDVNIYNVYGLTEASPRVSYLQAELFDQFPTSVGVPLRSIKVQLVDGELFIHGKNIMKGYYNDKTSTEMTIVDGWLHTGDIAEIDENGLIYIKSRKDNMIIRAGMNIYPQEIENALKKDRRIQDVLAFGVRDSKVGQKIHIKIVSDELNKSDILNLSKNNLPSYQYPDVIEFVPHLLRNGSGKLIRPKNEAAL